MTKKIILCFMFCAACFSFFFASAALARDTRETVKSEPIVVNGEKVEYLYAEKKVIGIDNVSIVYKDVKLTCDRIVVNMKTKEAVAEGNVVFTQGEYRYLGEKFHYNFENEKGTIIEAEARGEPWYAKGETASKLASEEYSIERGHLTTCNLPYPHYRLQARRVKIYTDNKVEAFHVLVFLGDVPIFYFPYYVHPLKDKRPRVTIVPGRNSRWGYYALTAWRYYLHEWSRGYIHLDYREKKGFGYGLDYKYKFGFFGKGLARVYYTKEDHVVTTEEREDGQSVGENRWRVQLRHKWYMDENTLAVGEFNKNSDKLFIKDYFFLDEYEKESQQKTFLSIIRTKREYNLSLYLQTRIHDFYTVLEKLPELKMEIKSQRVRDTNFYYKSTTSFAILQKKFAETIYGRDPKLKANRFDTNHQLSYQRKIFRFLTFNPYTSTRETWYSEDKNGDDNKFRIANTYGVRFSTKFFKVLDFNTNTFDLDINGLKHIVTPSVNYAYQPEPTVVANELKQFDTIDAIGPRNKVNISVVNRLLTKRGVERNVETVARFTTWTDILIKTKGNKSLDDLNFDLEITPYDWLVIDFDSRYNCKRNSIDMVNTYLAAEKSDHWRIGFSYRFEDDHLAGSNSQFTTDSYYRLGPKWKISSYQRFKKNSNEGTFSLEEQNYVLERDLHCWIAELNYQMRETDGLEVDQEHRVWLVMRLKAFPELPLKMFSKRYEQPRAGVDLRSSE